MIQRKDAKTQSEFAVLPMKPVGIEWGATTIGDDQERDPNGQIV
jgi:hypothetical protein